MNAHDRVDAVSDDEQLAGAYLSRVAEPGCAALWQLVRRVGLRTAADAVRSGDVDADVRSATVARASSVDPGADLDAAARTGIRMILPTSPEWPSFALAALEASALRAPERGVPPLALWVSGTGNLAELTMRSLAVVGSRASTSYGEHIASDWSYALAALGVTIVSGGAYGIDAAAHRGALAADGGCVLVSAGGLDRPYPTGNAPLYQRVAAAGILVSESPPGSAPQRHRFLSRNRLIAAFSAATLVVESARRSGALNTARHARDLGRPVLAVPGPVTSALSVGCHDLIRREEDSAVLVSTSGEVAEWCGLSDEVHGIAVDEPGPAPTDLLSPDEAAVLDGFPARGVVTEAALSQLSARPIAVVLRVLPALVDAGLVSAGRDGYRLVRP